MGEYERMLAQKAKTRIEGNEVGHRSFVKAGVETSKPELAELVKFSSPMNTTGGCNTKYVPR